MKAVFDMHDEVQDRSKSNARLAIILGLVAFGFFASGIYVMSGGSF